MKQVDKAMLMRSLLWAFIIMPAILLETFVLYSKKIPLVWFIESYNNFFAASLLLGLIVYLSAKMLDNCRFVSTLLAILLITISAISIGHCLVYDSVVSLGAIASVLESNPLETLEFLTIIPAWIYALISVYVLLCLILLLSTKRPDNFSIPLVSFQAAAFFMVGIVLMYTPVGMKKMAMEHGIVWKALNISYRVSPQLRPLSGYKFYRKEKQRIVNYKESIGDDAFSIIDADTQPNTVVLVVGESLRRDRMGIYGYHLDTTPKLSQRKSEMTIFENAISPAALTYFSVPRFLTTQTVSGKKSFDQSPSVIHLAKQGGYKTFWISNQGISGGEDGPASAIANIADERVFTNTNSASSNLDGRVIPHFERVIKDNAQRKFIVVHLMGSHPAFHRRYPESDNYFSQEHYEDTMIDEDGRSILAHYDNTVRYTDSIVDQLISKIADQVAENASLVFLADHGMILPTVKSAFYGHGYDDVMYDVPFFIWDKKKSELSNEIKQEGYLTENLIHTLSSLLRVRFEQYQPTLDILKTDYQEPKPYVLSQNQDVKIYTGKSVVIAPAK